MKKYFTIATIAAAALTVAACQKVEQEVPVDENTAAQVVELNDDGTAVDVPADEATEAAK